MRANVLCAALWPCLLREALGVVILGPAGNSTGHPASTRELGDAAGSKDEHSSARLAAVQTATGQAPGTAEELIRDGAHPTDEEAAHRRAGGPQALRWKRFEDTHGRAGGNLVVVFVVGLVFFGSAAAMNVCNYFFFGKLEGTRMGPYLKILTACWSWSCSSIGLQMLNKALVSHLKVPAFIAVFQMVFAVVCIMATSAHQFRNTTRRQLGIWMIVPVFFAGVLISSFYTFSFITLSLITVVRNLTPLVVLPIECAVMPAGKRPQVTIWSVAAILVMLAGAIMYAASLKGRSLSGLGILFAVVNLVIAATDRLIQRRLLTTECQGIPSSICTIMNNAFGALPTIAIACGTREYLAWTHVGHNSPWLDFKMYLLLVLSGFVGISIGYFGFECQRMISATSFFVMQNFSKIGTIVVGVLVFHDPFHGRLCVLGLVLSILGSFLYGYIQLKIAQAAARAPAPQQAAAEGKEPAGAAGAQLVK